MNSYTHCLPVSHQSQYVLIQILGSGGFGCVWSALRTSDKSHVAIKFISRAKVPPQGWARDPVYGVIPLECYLLRRINHPSVISFVDYFQTETYCFLVTELHGSPWTSSSDLPVCSPAPEYPSYQRSPFDLPVSPPPSPSSPVPFEIPPRRSCDLFECIEQHEKLSESQAKHILWQIASAVHFLHSNGVVHRDIKDENILIDSHFNVKLIDFGSASFIPTSRDKLFDRFLGTLQYAAPEIFLGYKYQGPEVEIWSLGCCLYIMLTGGGPFETPAQAVSSPLPIPSELDLSSECIHLLQWMFQKNPCHRPTIQQVIQHPWFLSYQQQPPFSSHSESAIASRNETPTLSANVGPKKASISKVVPPSTCSYQTQHAPEL